MIDISLPLKNRMITYPGDAHYEEYAYKTHETDHVHITRVLMETHAGTHFDAPFHMLPDGKKVPDIPIDKFMGRATVVECKGMEITAEDVPDKHNGIILFKTRNSSLYDDFHKDFTYLSLEAANRLISDRTSVVGVDYLSIEKFGFPDPIVHKTLLGSGVIIIEGLFLKDVAPGGYNFVGLPLKMSQDGAPLRAVLY